MDYEVVCERCRSAVLRAPHIGDPEADVMAAHLLEHHRNGGVEQQQQSFKALLSEFRVRMAG